MQEREARTALAHLVTIRISVFGRNSKIGVYCSDVSGAFDKVNSRRLLMKLHANGVPMDIQTVLNSWLPARKARVAVGVHFSWDIVIRDMVHQDTVLGLPVWNVFYEDATLTVRLHEFNDMLFRKRPQRAQNFGTHPWQWRVVSKVQKC